MAFNEFNCATSEVSFNLISKSPSLTSCPDLMGTVCTRPPNSVLSSTPLNARTLPTLVNLGCHSEDSITMVETVAGGKPIPAMKFLIKKVFSWLKPKIKPSNRNTPQSMMVMRRGSGSIAINFSWALVPRHFCPMRAQKAFAFSQRAMALSRNFHSIALRFVHAHKARTKAMSLFLICSRSFILIFVRYVFWFKSGAFTIPPATTQRCK